MIDNIMPVYPLPICPLQIFLDMAVLVDAQGEMLDNIETQVFQILPPHEPQAQRVSFTTNNIQDVFMVHFSY